MLICYYDSDYPHTSQPTNFFYHRTSSSPRAKTRSLLTSIRIESFKCSDSNLKRPTRILIYTPTMNNFMTISRKMRFQPTHKTCLLDTNKAGSMHISKWEPQPKQLILEKTEARGKLTIISKLSLISCK